MEVWSTNPIKTQVDIGSAFLKGIFMVKYGRCLVEVWSYYNAFNRIFTCTIKTIRVERLNSSSSSLLLI